MPQEFIERFATFLKSRSMQLTPEWEQLLGEIRSITGTFTLTDLFHAQRHYPKPAPNRATVFRTFVLLMEAGLIEAASDTGFPDGEFRVVD